MRCVEKMHGKKKEDEEEEKKSQVVALCAVKAVYASEQSFEKPAIVSLERQDKSKRKRKVIVDLMLFLFSFLFSSFAL